MHPTEKKEKILQVAVEKLQTPTEGEASQSATADSETSSSTAAEAILDKSDTGPSTSVEPSENLTMDVSMENQEDKIKGW